MDTVIVAIAVDVVEFKRDRNFKPRIQAAPLTAVLLDTFAQQSLLQMADAVIRVLYQYLDEWPLSGLRSSLQVLALAPVRNIKVILLDVLLYGLPVPSVIRAEPKVLQARLHVFRFADGIA